MINQVILIGYAGDKAELKSLANGTPVARLSVATSENWQDKASGEWKSESQWHNVIMWNRLAEVIAGKVQKGNRIFVQGKIKYREYEKDGIKRYATDIVAETVRILEKQDGSNPDRFPSEPPLASEKHYTPLGEPKVVSMPAAAAPIKDDDLPF